MMKRALAASCLRRERLSHSTQASGTRYGGRLGWSAASTDPSNWLTSVCRRSCAMSLISWFLLASASACVQHMALYTNTGPCTPTQGLVHHHRALYNVLHNNSNGHYTILYTRIAMDIVQHYAYNSNGQSRIMYTRIAMDTVQNCTQQ